MQLSKKLIVIAAISFVVTMVLFFLDSDPAYPGFSGALKTVFEIGLMTFLIFCILAINYFALSFFIRKITKLF